MKRNIHFCGEIRIVMKKIFFLLLGTIALTNCTENNSSDKKIKVDVSHVNTPKGELHKITGEAQGTTYSISYFSENPIDFKPAVDSILLDIDNALSTWNQASLITELNGSDSNSVTFNDYNDYFSDNFRLSRKVWKDSEGAFDPSLFPIINAWGFGFKNKENVTQTMIDSMKQFVGFDFENIRLSKTDDRDAKASERIFYKKDTRTQLEFNAIAQGYSVDVISNHLNKNNVASFMIELGGEVITKGIKADGTPWRIGIDKPNELGEKRELQAIVQLVNKAIATSGSYRKYYIKDGVKYSHTIDPKTGYPVNHNLLSATVLYDNCGLADAYATAFMVMGVEKTKAFVEKNKAMEMEIYLIYTDEEGNFQTYMTPGFEKLIEV